MLLSKIVSELKTATGANQKEKINLDLTGLGHYICPSLCLDE